MSEPAWPGLTGQVSKPLPVRYSRISFDGRAGFGEAPTIAMLRTLKRMSRIVWSSRPSAAIGGSVAGLALLDEGGHAFGAVGLGEVLDHRLGGERVGHVQRLVDLRIEGALADCEGRGGMRGDLARQRLRGFERRSFRDDAVDEPGVERLLGR